MSNIIRGVGDEGLGSGKKVLVTYVDRSGQKLGEQEYTRHTVEEAREIPRGNRVPYLPNPNWRLFEISADGTVWTIDL